MGRDVFCPQRQTSKGRKHDRDLCSEDIKGILNVLTREISEIEGKRTKRRVRDSKAQKLGRGNVRPRGHKSFEVIRRDGRQEWQSDEAREEMEVTEMRKVKACEQRVGGLLVPSVERYGEM
jgi:hypothetical protein